MSLSDEVTSRVSAAKLVSLTNPDDTTATSVNSTRLGLAATDAAADFEVHAQVVYDGTDARHVRIGVARVVALLTERKGDGGAAKMLADTKQMLVDLSRVSSRGRILPRTNSVVVPTSEQEPDGGTPRPDFDRKRFDDFVPGSPPSPDSWNT